MNGNGPGYVTISPLVMAFASAIGLGLGLLVMDQMRDSTSWLRLHLAELSDVVKGED
jgi:hypothetical protein